MKGVLIILTVFLAVASCNASNKNKSNMLGLFEQKDPIEKFWTWFKANQNRIKKFQKNPDKYISEVLAQIKKIKNGLAIELEPPKNNIINMTISADGDKNLFKVVQNIVKKAPVMGGWKIIAFRQRMGLEKYSKIKLEVAGQKLEIDKMKFFPIASGDSLDIIIYVKGITDDNFDQIAYGGLLIVDNLLGEYDCVTKVRHYDFQKLPTNKDELKDLLPLVDLSKFVDKFHSDKK